MTPRLKDAIIKVAHAQIAVAPSVANTQGQDVADNLKMAYEALLVALEEIEEKKPSVFGERVFTTKRTKKST